MISFHLLPINKEHCYLTHILPCSQILSMNTISTSYWNEVAICTGGQPGCSYIEIQQEQRILSSIQQIWQESVSRLLNSATRDASSYQQEKEQFSNWFLSLPSKIREKLKEENLDEKMIERLTFWRKTTRPNQEWIVRYLSDPIFNSIDKIACNDELPIPDAGDVIKDPIEALKAQSCPLLKLEASLFEQDINTQVRDVLKLFKMEREGPTLYHGQPALIQAEPVLKFGMTASVESCPDTDYLAPPTNIPCSLVAAGSALDKTSQQVAYFVQQTIDRLCRAMLRTQMLCSKEEVETIIKNEIRQYFPGTDLSTMPTLISNLPESYRLDKLLQAVEGHLAGNPF